MQRTSTCDGVIDADAGSAIPSVPTGLLINRWRVPCSCRHRYSMDEPVTLLAPRPLYRSTARRIGWADLPVNVRKLIDTRVGGGARADASAGGGFTSGFAARVRGDGGSFFVKAAGGENSFAAESYLTEARINRLLPAVVPAPRLRWTEETDDGWVVLGFDPVDGQMPGLPWRADELAAALDAYASAAEALGPVPDTFATAALDKIADHGDEFAHWRHRAAGAADTSPLPKFLPSRWIEPLAALEAGWGQATAGINVLHHDLRADNILIEKTGKAVICDWNWAVIGAPWLDLTVLLAGAFTDGHDATTLIMRHPSAAGADPEQIDVALAALAGFFVEHGGQQEVPGAPALRGHQWHCAEIVLRWLAARRGWRLR